VVARLLPNSEVEPSTRVEVAVKDKLPGAQAIAPTKLKSPTVLALVVAGI
jgi:hypothetical protein